MLAREDFVADIDQNFVGENLGVGAPPFEQESTTISLLLLTAISQG
jgi:hypothetical protein